ncbi:MAG: guanylate kinase [Deltaproteobacteria bacterium]|jgi:guanylate kinase|nr:guanylate kinase [Deltaproteobacteria bacterium]
MERTGLVLVVCAPSGTGKTTLIKMLMHEFSQIGYSTSCTTRSPRHDEVPGHDYNFVTHEEFHQLQRSGYFAEWADVYGHFYGTPLNPTLDILRTGKDVLFDIDVQGAAQLRLTLPVGSYVFILPPSLKILEERLRKRAQDSEEAIQRRLSAVRDEVLEAHWFDAWIVNDDLHRTYDALRSVYIAATLAPRRRPLIIRSILDGKTAS